MVRIQRSATRRGHKGGVTSFVACRNVILALAAIQVLRMTVKMMSSENTLQPPNTPDAGYSPPKDKLDILRDSKQVRRPAQNTPDKKPIYFQPPKTNTHNMDANFIKQHEKHQDAKPNVNIHDDGVHNEPNLPDEDPPHDHIVDPDEHVEPEMPHEDADPDHDREQQIHNNKNDAHPTNLSRERQIGAPINGIVLNKKGSGPTKVGYVKDFEFEVANPEFRNVGVKLNGTEVVAKLLNEASVKPCHILQEGRQIIDPKCLDTDTPLIAYNSADFPRTWCGGTEIKPLTAVQLEHGRCDPTFTTDPVHIFSMSSAMREHFPPVSGQGMPPIIVKSHRDEITEADLESVECNIPCKHEKGIDGFRLYIDGQSWTITQTMQDSWSSQIAKIDRTDYRMDQYYSTQSFKSSVPLTYFDFSKHSLRNRPPLDWDTAKNRAVYMVNTACASQASKRNKYFHATSAAYPVDAMGTCQHNVDVPEGHTIDTL